MTIQKLRWVLTFVIPIGLLVPAYGQGAAPEADVAVTKDGKTLSGKITSMDEGKVRIETGNGVENIAAENLQSFRIRSNSASGVDERTLRTLIANQEEMGRRLELLIQSITSLERQLMNVQTNQSIQSRRLTERTSEVNPLAKVVVLDYKKVRRGGNTYIVGQVSNQSETVVSNVQVHVTVFGSRGKLSTLGGQASKAGYTSPGTISPGQAASFEVRFEGLLLIENLNVQIAGYPPQGGMGSLPFRINGPYQGF